jgi:hypothetical protein
MAPMVHGLEAKYFGSITFNYLDADDPATRDFQAYFGFRYQPEIYLIDGQGVVLEKWVGYVSQETLEDAFAKYLD